PTHNEMPAGLMGRQVAGKEFLDAYLTHGDWDEVVALVPNAASAESFKQTCLSHPSSRDRQRRLQIAMAGTFYDSYLPSPASPQLYFPNPPDPRYAWIRTQGPPHAYALSGVTHTLCSARAVDVLRTLVTDPWQPYDRLICTSRAVRDMVVSVTDAWADDLRDRHGGQPRRSMPLEIIPLGVSTERFRPATPEERAAERGRLGIAADELAVLFVGRLSHHAKAHPFPMYRAMAQAAGQTGRKACLLMVGWAANDAVQCGFEDAARAFAPGVRVEFLDGLRDENRFGAWRAADVFCSLSDNIQETFGLVIVEAMASGLPVVASDWNGYRDLVVDGATGFLVPTIMVRGATDDLTARLLLGEVNYDHFLAQASQCVAVDSAAAARAFARLFEDADLRRRMGEAGRQRAVREFAWPVVIRAYENLWQAQEAERAERAAQAGSKPPRHAGPAAYPAPERSFAGYPARWLDEHVPLVAAPDAAARLAVVAELPLTNHEARFRVSDAGVLMRLVERPGAVRTAGDLIDELAAATGATPVVARATLAWLMKYDLLRVAEAHA
ncbi:MAG TPA: glycosyltransferase family 4 protein, partial [Planctomycetaceae bacterium]|nr:glycosyltransferase family 4 protein [Planctomycetaceae bacterium]